MEAFSDGVFAIAITLLVLDVAVHPPGTPLEQVLHAWPAYMAYVVSFLTIGAGWLVHTALTDRLAQSDSIFLRLNLLLLLVVAFLPFPTVSARRRRAWPAPGGARLRDRAGCRASSSSRSFQSFLSSRCAGGSDVRCACVSAAACL
jgi:Endosomal/lysosomal potassium channel TMEM175